MSDTDPYHIPGLVNGAFVINREMTEWTPECPCGWRGETHATPPPALDELTAHNVAEGGGS